MNANELFENRPMEPSLQERGEWPINMELYVGYLETVERAFMEFLENMENYNPASLDAKDAEIADLKARIEELEAKLDPLDADCGYYECEPVVIAELAFEMAADDQPRRVDTQLVLGPVWVVSQFTDDDGLDIGRPYVFRTEREAIAELKARRALESASDA